MAAKAELKISVSIGEVGNNQQGGPNAEAFMSLAQVFGDGTTANNIDRVYMAERTVTTGANDDIDLSGSAIQTLLGANIAAVELVGIIIFNKPLDPNAAANTTNLTIGGSGSGVPGFVSAGLTIKPGGCFCAMSPDAAGLATVTNSTGDIIRVTNSAGASNKYMICLLLRSA